ncbi:MAG: hypothetical protein RBT57_04835 [Paludibacter sp.]|nr:hypothetical protein [Paludibacter sp.]
MRKLTLFIFSLSLITTISNASDVSVNFSSAEGFVDGSLFNNENWDATFTYPGNWIVNVASESISADKTFQWARWGRQFNLYNIGDKITFRVEFDCEIASMPTSNSLMMFGFIAKPTVGSSSEDNPKMNLVHLKKAATVIQLRNNANTANLVPTAQLNLTDIDDAGSTRTKLLAIEVSLTLGADAASTTISGRIFNVTDNTSSDQGFYSGINPELFNSIASTGIYGTFGTAANNCQPTVYKVSMTDLTTSLGLNKNEAIFSMSDKKLIISGLEQNEEVFVYSVTGNLCMKTKYNGGAIDLSLLSNGYYIIKTSTFVRKIGVK